MNEFQYKKVRQGPKTTVHLWNDQGNFNKEIIFCL